jgi:hypothetical protein
MKARSRKAKKHNQGESRKVVTTAVPKSTVPPREEFLEEARREPKRKLVWDHIETINHLRNEKRFTFRDIAAWLTARGVEMDHSAVYRAYIAAIPEDQRNPHEDWTEVDETLPD